MSRLNTIAGRMTLAGVLGLGASPAMAANFIVNVGVNAAGAQANSFTDAGSNSSPAVTNARIGDTVTFNNIGTSPGFHNVVSDTGATRFRCANGCDGVGSGSGDPSAANWTATISLASVGTINYFCEVHGGPGVGMFGTINVTVPVELQSFEVD
jgi:plastocyanin